MHSASHTLINGRGIDSQYGDRMTQDSRVPQESTQTSARSLEFVTFSSPQEAKGPKARFIVRSQALKNYHAKRKQLRVVKQPHGPYQKSREDILCHYELNKVNSATLQRYIENPSPNGLLGAGRVDPFSSYPRAVNHYEHLVLDYYVTHFCAQNDPIYPPEFSNALTTIWLPRAMKDVGMLDGMLLIAARDLAKVLPLKELSSLILQLRGRVICDVNMAISDGLWATKDESIATLLQLAFDEMSTGNFEALKTHAKALKLIVKSRGDLSTSGFEGFLGFLITRVKLISAHYEPFKSPSPKSSPTSRIAASVESLKPGFLAQEIFDNLSIDMITVLNNFCALSEFLQRNPNAGLPPVGSFQIEAAFSDFETQWLRLFNSKKQAAQLFDQPDIENCMITAAGLYRSRILYENDALFAQILLSAPEREHIVNSYMAGIVRIYNCAKRVHYLELLLWMVFVGSLSNNMAANYSFWPWMIRKLSVELHLVCWVSAREKIKEFMWIDQRCERPGQRLWQEAERVNMDIDEPQIPEILES